ncbi:methyltransferase [Azospirillum doebereinerae]|uniref:tetratricopeptide repeat protein n=1 Tax=Azospirillum doebereinerae TaxID=92933 RepID=UPI001EE592B2|nr:methyltransferase [Azospirillum doebereinerae]MCG5238504.1 tetratricopeptide repeat protein [Azospirillum doebereinerae]
MAASRLSLRGGGARGKNAASSPAARLSRQADALASAGRHAEADAAYRAALEADPTLAGTRNNHGNTLRALGRIAEAAGAYRAALAHGLDAALVHYNLASALRQLGETGEAEAAYRRALVRQPDHAEAWNNQANLLRDADRLEEAATGYRRAVTLRPDWGDGHDNFGSALYLLHERGAVDAAARLARLWRRDHPGNPVARHIGAAIAGDGAEPRAPDAYVRQTFDLFAEEFDSKLAELGYRAPELLAARVAADGESSEGGLDVLDAGCGTGLCAAALRPLARRLTGVDLSGGMLERARARQLYDALEEAELVAFLTGRPSAFDLIVAADVLCYFGVLDEALAAAAKALRPGGRLAFTVEALEAAGDAPHRVATHGRYAHRAGYVRATLATAGLEVAVFDRDTLRMESGAPVAGLVVLARRPALSPG